MPSLRRSPGRPQLLAYPYLESFAGAPRWILYDRTNLPVSGVDADGQSLRQQRFAGFALDMGVLAAAWRGLRGPDDAGPGRAGHPVP